MPQTHALLAEEFFCDPLHSGPHALWSQAGGISQGDESKGLYQEQEFSWKTSCQKALLSAAVLGYFKGARLQPRNSSPCCVVIDLGPSVVKKKWCSEFRKYSSAFGGFLSILSTSLASSAASGTSERLTLARQRRGRERSVALISSPSLNRLVPFLLSLRRALINQACPRE